MNRTLVVPLIVLLAYPPAVLADTAGPASPSLSQQIVRTPTRGLDRLAQSAETIAARLAESGPTLARDEQTSQRGDSWIDRHPIWTGALVGAGAGAAYGARRCANDGCASRGSGGGALVGAAWGAGFGAMIGLILDAALKDFP